MKNINIVNKIVAKELNKSLNVVSAVNSFYWKAVKEKMIGLDVYSLFMKEIGTFTISKHKLYEEIYKLISKLRKLKTTKKYNEETRIRIIEQQTIRLRILLYHRNLVAEEEVNRRLFKLARKNQKESDTDTTSITEQDQGTIKLDQSEVSENI